MSDKSSRSEFSPQAEAAIHLERAAFHLHEAARLHNPDLPDWDSTAERAHRVEARYRAAGAHRRGIPSVRKVAIERGAIALAVADGERWPACNRAINPQLPEAQRKAIAASRRQRYMHLSTVVLSDVLAYYEVNEDNEEQRQKLVDAMDVQRTGDAHASQTWRNRMPSTVSQLRKDETQ